MSGKPTSSRSRRRLLTAEEAVLWVEVTKSVKARPGATLPATTARQPKEQVPALELRDPVTPAIPSTAPKQPQRPLPLATLEKRLKQRLSRGRVDVDASIDLHGLRQDEAHVRLRRFLVVSHGAGARVVLVVTGKGRTGSPGETWTERGVLRRNVPLWLAEPDLRHIVLAFEEASAGHGGAGALYIRLRRNTRKGS